MALITASVIIRSLALFHLTLAFFFLSSPSTIADQGLVHIMGEAMGLSLDRSFDRRSAPLSFLGAVFALLGVGDLASISLPEEIRMYFWGVQAPTRLALFFAYTFYSYAFSPSSPLHKNTHNHMKIHNRSSPPKTYTPSGWGGEHLQNRLFFTWAFLEMVAWFWVYFTVREEKREMALRIQIRRAKEEGRL